jgi:hypothetical protein
LWRQFVENFNDGKVLRIPNSVKGLWSADFEVFAMVLPAELAGTPMSWMLDDCSDFVTDAVGVAWEGLQQPL